MSKVLVCVHGLHGGGTQLFFLRVCAARVEKYGLESGFSLQNEGSWERKLRNFVA